MARKIPIYKPPKFWKDFPILSWVIDDFEQFNAILGNFNLTDYLKDYINNSYDNKIAKVLFSAPLSLNLGGDTKKNKLIATDKPIGVFNFSLASKTLYPVSEFYSERLAKQDPNRFSNLNLQSGVVPNILIDFIVIGGENKYFYKDELGIEYPCIKRVKGQTAIDNGVPNAKLEYKSKTKKVYQTYKRKGGKVRYVEIYSLFYYDRVYGDLEMAIRHLPAMMVAEYLESIGVKVRIYMTRFVQLYDEHFHIREYSLQNNTKLPMYEEAPIRQFNNDFTDALLIQPIIAKEFQQEVNNPLAYLISSENFREVYNRMAENTIRQETTQGYVSVYGHPQFDNEKYWEGFERYKNKYQKYVELGIFKSKEVLADSMILFHDMSINEHLHWFLSDVTKKFRPNNTKLNDSDAIIHPEVNPFFNWWMKTSANTIKHKVNLINSNELNKDLREMKSDVETTYLELKRIIDATQNTDLKSIFTEYGENVMESLFINEITLPSGSKIVDFNKYVNQLLVELTVFADDDFFPTPEDEVIRRLEFKATILEELKKV